MLSIGAMAAGQGNYYAGLAREDYYLEGGEPPGRWWGRGAEALGLSGTVSAAELRCRFEGHSPNGAALVRNAGEKNHRPGWDFTFSAPKSVSVLWSQADPKTRQEIQEAHHDAVRAALSYLQDDATFGRRGQGGRERISAGLVVATFEHGTSRALDPQLHTHSLFMNLALLPDGSATSLFSKPLYAAKMTAGALYRAELAAGLTRRLGVTCEAKESWFEVRGVPESLCVTFSKRRAEILKLLGERGLETASAAAFATLSTREAKTLVPPREKLFAEWQRIGREHGFDIQSIARAQRLGPDLQDYRRAAAAVRAAITTITEQHSHFSKSEILRAAVKRSMVLGIGSDALRQAVAVATADPKRVVDVGELKGERRYTTPQMLAIEKKLLESAARLKNARGQKVGPRTVENILTKYSAPRSAVLQEAMHHATQIIKAARGVKTEKIDRPHVERNAKAVLTGEQAETVRRLTAKSGRLQALSGMAGTGKTFTLQVCREVWEKSGYKVLGGAVSAKAAKELEKGSGIKSDTLTMLEMRMHPSLAYELKHHGRQLLRAAMNKPTYKLEHLKIDSQTVLVVDEAGMVGTKQMARLIATVEQGGGKLVLVGDAKQLQPISAGAPFRAITERHGAAELTEIVRQKDPRDREAVRALASGDAKRALHDLAARGRVHVEGFPEKTMDKLVADWKARHLRNPEKALVLAGTNAQVNALNHLCQGARADAGLLDGKQRVRIDEGYLNKGDRVLLTKNSRTLDVQNGTMGTAVSVDERRKTITVQTDAGARILIPLSDYRHERGPNKGEMAVRLGYAVTTHKGQGTTVDYAYVLVGGPMQDRELSYVQASRTRHETHLYTDRRNAGPGLTELARQMAESGMKSLAHDVPRLAERESKQRLQPTVER